jgi:branched-chain amino acid transport system permease protein
LESDVTELYQALVQGILIGSTYGLLALGMGLVYGVSGVVNFSHGDFISLGMFMCLALYSSLTLDPYVSVIITVPVMTAIGALVYLYLIRPMVGHQFLMIVQLTLGLSLVIQNGILMVFGGQPARTPSVVESKLLILGEVVLRLPHLIAFAVSFILAIGLYIMLRSTDFGRSIRAVHQNTHAAALMGINVGRVQVLTFALGIGILALAAALLLPGTPIQPTQGLRYTVITLLVVVLGGMTNFVGIMLGGLIIGLAEAFGTIYLSGVLGLLMPYLIFVAIMLFRPQGLTWSSSR